MTWENYLVNRVSEVLKEPSDKIRLEKTNTSHLVLRPNYICIFYTENGLIIGLHPKTQHLLNAIIKEKDIENYIENKLFLRLGYVQRELHPPFNQTYRTINNTLSNLDNYPKMVKKFRKHARKNIRNLNQKAFLLYYTNNINKVLINNCEMLFTNFRTNFLDVIDNRYYFYKKIANYLLYKGIHTDGLFIIYNKSIQDDVCFCTINNKNYIGIKDSTLDTILTIPDSLEDILLNVKNKPIRNITLCG